MVNLTVYRVRFRDINTGKYVMSEGMMTEAAAWARNMQVDKTTALQVNGTDVYMGIYKPRPVMAQLIHDDAGHFFKRAKGLISR